MNGGSILSSIVLWQAVFPGHTDVQLWPDPDEGVIYHTAAWGLAYAAIRLRKLDARTGAQLATASLGHRVTALDFPPDPSGLFAATEQRLFCLDRKTLEVKQRWDRGIPKGSDQLLCIGDHLMITSSGGSLCWFHPETAKCLSRRGSQAMSLFRDGAQLLGWSSSDASLFQIDPQTAQRKKLLSLPHPCTAFYQESSRCLWLYGPCDKPQYVERQDFQTLRRVYLDEPKKCDIFRLDFDIGGLVVSPDNRLLLCIEVTWQESRLRWIPTTIRALSLPQFTSAGVIALEPAIQGVYVLPGLNSILTIVPHADRDSLLACYDLAGCPSSSRDFARFMVEWDQLTPPVYPH